MTRKEKLKKAVREIIVRRREVERMARIPYMRETVTQMAIALLLLAKQHRLDYALITRKF